MRLNKLKIGWFICLGLYLFCFITVLGANRDIVAKHRAKYPTPLGIPNTISLLKDVASEVKGGLYIKTTGNNCQGYSCDIVCFADGRGFDILIDSEGQAIPTWNPVSGLDKNRCELVTVPIPPAPIPNDPIEIELLKEIRDLLKEIKNLLL